MERLGSILPSIKTKQNKMPTFKGLPVKLFSKLRDNVKMSQPAICQNQNQKLK